MKRFIVGLMIILSVLQVSAQAQSKLNVTVPDAKLTASLATADTLSQVNTDYKFEDKTDLESQFKEARYLLQKDEMYVAYNKDKEVLEIGLFACY